MAGQPAAADPLIGGTGRMSHRLYEETFTDRERIALIGIGRPSGSPSWAAVSARHALGKTSEHAAGHDVVGRGDQGSVGIVEPPGMHAAPVADQYPRAAVVGIQGECPDPVECRAETDIPSGREMGA